MLNVEFSLVHKSQELFLVRSLRQITSSFQRYEVKYSFKTQTISSSLPYAFPTYLVSTFHTLLYLWPVRVSLNPGSGPRGAFMNLLYNNSDITAPPARQPRMERKRVGDTDCYLHLFSLQNISDILSNQGVYILITAYRCFVCPLSCHQNVCDHLCIFHSLALHECTLYIYKVIRAMKNRAEQTGVPSH